MRLRNWLRRLPRSAPAGVIVTLEDGREIGPLPLRYQGRCSHGHHKWAALTAARLAPQVRSVSIDLLPPGTEVTIVFMPDAVLAAALDGSPDQHDQ
jgi:hypothetical protein